MSWLKESNRDKHFKYAIIVSVIAGFVFTAGVGVGMEVKDKLRGGQFDWLDLTATLLGAFVGIFIRFLIVFLVVATIATLSC